MASNSSDGAAAEAGGGVDIRFSHIQLYADSVAPLSEYQALAADLDRFHASFDGNTASGGAVDIAEGRKIWSSLRDEDAASFVPHGRDVVKQLIAGFGFRVTGCYPDPADAGGSATTRSVAVTSGDPGGVQIVVTAANDGAEGAASVAEGGYRHFDAANVRKFYNAHSNRQGIAVLAFEVRNGTLDRIFDRYARLHPALIPEEYSGGTRTYENEARVLEVYAYYRGERGGSGADEGTRLRFVEPVGQERDGGATANCKLPGMVGVPAEFRGGHAAYFDHWVSNVNSRTGFLETLEDVLSFTPKVDFNAGVVAAGEAQIESTVTGNRAALTTAEKDAALRDQSQIYLPINNALTNVGHVHGFLEEIGQGVQHVASRVGNIIDFVQQANDRRKMFGEGFTFLNIPRSYYGILTKEMLMKGRPSKEKSTAPSGGLLSWECAGIVYDICAAGGLLHDDGSLVLEASKDAVGRTIEANIPASHLEEYLQNREEVVRTVLHSRYANLWNLLRDHLSEESYVAIVRNQILVDVQGEDLLFQIFTCNILQRASGEEAPFFEFIQRVCSECTGPDGCPKQIKPGCGGFGIRNFLTLFLSIEVTKAMLAASNAKDCGDTGAYDFAQRKVELFTEQLNESNPLLTAISDAMTREGIARDHLAASSCQEEKKDDGGHWKLEMEKEAAAKARANEELMLCNLKYQRLMKELRESHDQ